MGVTSRASKFSSVPYHVLEHQGHDEHNTQLFLDSFGVVHSNRIIVEAFVCLSVYLANVREQ